MKRILYILVLFAAVTAQAQVARVVTNGLASYWSFENGEVRDRIGVNNGTIVAGMTFAPNSLGNAGSFNKSSQYVNTGKGNLNLSGINTVTLTAWVNPTTPIDGGTQIIIASSNGADYGQYYLAVVNGGLPFCLFVNNNSPGGQKFFAGVSVLKAGAWTHLAAVLNGATISLYVNGVLDASTNTFSGSLWNNPTTRILLGAFPSGGSGAANYWGGKLDEICVFTRALSAQEIASLYNSRRPSP